MKKFLLLIPVFVSLYAFGQTPQTATPAQLLRLARATYEQGRLHEVEKQLKGVINDPGTSDEEKVEAYKILCFTYIYLEEPVKADSAMLNILDTEHFFEVNEAVDPAEFVALHKTFRTKPLFNIGLKVGPSATFPVLKTNYAVGGSAAEQGEYKQNINIQIGLVFEKMLLPKMFDEKLTAAPEILFSNRNFTYTHQNLFVADDSQASRATQTVEHEQSWIDLNLLFKYEMAKKTPPGEQPRKRALTSHVSLGPAISSLMTASATAETQYTNGQVTSGSPLDMKPHYRSLGISVIANGGIKYKFGAIYLTADVRYQYGITKIVNEEKRSHPEAIFDYALSPNIFSQQNATFLVGFIYPWFSPKKLASRR